MQRKNYILKRSAPKTSRNAMAMIMAITVIVIMSSIMALSLSMTAQTSKRTTDLYLYEQSQLLAKSAVEYALLKIAQNPPCSNLDETFTQDGIYNISISMQYIYDSDASCVINGGTLYTTVTTPEQNGSALIDVGVSVTDTTVSTEPIRYFRRTIQKL